MYFKRAIRLGRLFGVAIEIHWSWFIIFTFVAWTIATYNLPGTSPGLPITNRWIGGVIAALLFFACLLGHELAHTLVALRSGLHIPAITLFLFGGVSQLSEEPRSPGSEFKIAAAGPLTSFALAALSYAVWRGMEAWGSTQTPLAVALVLAWVNAAVGVFNLLPALPLDGGRLLRAMLWKVWGNFVRATRTASILGRVMGALVIAAGVLQVMQGTRDAVPYGLWLMLIGWFVIQAAASSYVGGVLRQALAGLTVAPLTTEIRPVAPELTLADLVNQWALPRAMSLLPVVRGVQLIGIVTVEQVRDIPRPRWPWIKVGELARPVPEELLAHPEQDAFDALSQMLRAGVERLLVVRCGELLGVISRSGLSELVRVRLSLGF